MCNQKSVCEGEWVDRGMDQCVGVWKGVKFVLRIAYSNKKFDQFYFSFIEKNVIQNTKISGALQ